MQKLHMVGFTTDHRGLIFSVRRNAKSGGYVVNVDAPIIEAIDELKALLVEEAAADAESDSAASRPQSALSVREIQARLRRGRTIDQVAREAGVEPSWISRFAVPVLAEQAEVIRAARATHMTKQRNNVSALPLGEAVYRNIAERGVTDPRDQLDKEWRARQLTEGMWLVTFAYTSRGRENKAQWEYDESSRVIRARGRLGGSIGFREGPRRLAPPAARQASTSTGARPAKTSAAKKHTAKKKAAKKKAAKKAPAKRATTKTTAARKTVGKKTVAKKTVAKAAAARSNPAMRRSAAAVPAVPRTVVARKVVAEAPTTARQSASRQAVRRVATLRRAAAARLEAEAEKATRRDIAAVRKAAKRTVVIPPRLVPPPVPAGPLLVDELVAESEPGLDLRWDAVAVDDPDRTAEPQAEVEVEVEAEVDVDDAIAEDDDARGTGTDTDTNEEPVEPDVVEDAEPVEPEAEPQAEPEVEPRPATRAAPQANVQIPRPTRREPLRARPRPGLGEGNGPVFRSDLAPIAGEALPAARSAVGQPADVPLSMPLEPIEPPPRRRRLRPLRGR